jgi:DNA primase
MTAAVDVAGLKQSIDLLALVGGDSKLRKVASTRGGEYAGPCPFCGGKDRFRVQPARGQWWCRSCSPDERWSDAIAYVERRDGVDFREACDRLGGGGSVSATADTTRPAPLAAPPDDPEPSDTWRAAGRELVERAEALLWSDAGTRARDYLHERGLTDDTLRAWRVGFVDADRWETGGRWDVDAGRVKIARGITIPWLLDGQLWQIKIRRGEDDPKYISVSGGHPLIYGAHTLPKQRAALALEGEFDAMLAWQEAGDLIGTFTLGGCSAPLRPRALSYFLPLSRVLVVYDNDVDGQKGAAALVARSARMRLVHVPAGKDLTEYRQSGGDIWRWTLGLLATHAPIKTRGAA